MFSVSDIYQFAIEKVVLDVMHIFSVIDIHQFALKKWHPGCDTCVQCE
jgi:hypothetical protein